VQIGDVVAMNTGWRTSTPVGIGGGGPEAPIGHPQHGLGSRAPIRRARCPSVLASGQGAIRLLARPIRAPNIMSEPTHPPFRQGTVGRLLGGFLLCVVVGVYVSSRLHGHWPPSHPWSGMSLSLTGILNLLQPRRRIALPLCVLGLCSAVLWAWSANLLSRQSAPMQPATPAESSSGAKAWPERKTSEVIARALAALPPDRLAC
jgi:hypothetical protein